MTSTANKNISEKSIIAALNASGGVLTIAAEKLGCTRQNLYVRMQSSKKLRDARESVDDVLLDMCDAAFIKLIQAGDGAMCRWYAERKGKKRGYANKVENSFDEQQLEAIVVALGGDPAKLASALRSLGVDPDQT